MKPVVLILVCHYNNSEELERFIYNLSNQSNHGFDVRVAICDNTLNCNINVDSELISIFTPNGNLGYMGGCHFAMTQWVRKYNLQPIWVSLTNSDLELEINFFATLFNLNLSEEVSVIAPHIISVQDNLPQNPYMLHRPHAYKIQLLKILYSNIYIYIFYLFLHKLRRRISGRTRPEYTSSFYIYAPHGSAVFFHKSFFEKGSTLESEIFLYGEELYIGEQCRLHQQKVLYVPTLIVYHEEHTSTGLLKKKRIIEYAFESLNYLQNKYWNK